MNQKRNATNLVYVALTCPAAVLESFQPKLPSNGCAVPVSSRTIQSASPYLSWSPTRCLDWRAKIVHCIACTVHESLSLICCRMSCDADFCNVPIIYQQNGRKIQLECPLYGYFGTGRRRFHIVCAESHPGSTGTRYLCSIAPQVIAAHPDLPEKLTFTRTAVLWTFACSANKVGIIERVCIVLLSFFFYWYITTIKHFRNTMEFSVLSSHYSRLLFWLFLLLLLWLLSLLAFISICN